MAANTVRAGSLDRRIKLQRSSGTTLPSGEVVDGWTDLAIRWARVRPLVGNEASAGQLWIAREQVEFTIRWDNVVKDISPMDRIVYPADDESNERSLYDIFAVHEYDLHVSLRISAVRQSDIPSP